MATLTTITNAIQSVIQDDSYTDMTDRINDAINNISGGIRMPNGDISSPLNDLYVSTTIQTTSDPYVSLPANYQRNVFYVIDSRGDRIKQPKGGNYYSFMLFLNNAYKKDLTQTGMIVNVCVKGRKLYYQGIPSTPTNLTVSYYKIPESMINENSEPECIPDHLQTRLIKHYVCREIFGEGIEDGDDSKGTGYSYHSNRFFDAMTDLVDFNGIDAEPKYYSGGSW